MSTIKQDRKDFEMLLNGIAPSTDPTIIPASVPVTPTVDGANPGFTPEKMFDFDYDGTKKGLRKKARKTLLNIIKHILPDDLLEEDYIKDKMEQDTDTLADLYMQLEVNNVMQRSLVDSVSRGNSMPRMYEVFGQLSDKIQALNKQIVSTEQTIRKTYIDLKMEIRDKQSEAGGQACQQNTLMPGQSTTVSSSKQLIEMAKQRHLEKLKEAKMAEYEEE